MDSHSELRLVTSVFIDVVGSTETIVRIGPERMQRLLSEAFGELSEFGVARPKRQTR